MKIFGYLIPFRWLPGSIGLKGKTFEIAKAEYELEGFELENKLIEINHVNDNASIQKEKLKIKLKYKVIDEYEFDEELSNLEDDDKLASLNAKRKHDKITEDEYEKQKADLLKEPWSKLTIKPNLLNNSKIVVGIDYNDYFINWLEGNGYDGIDDENVMIEAYLNDTYIAILEELNGLDINEITPTHRDDPEEE